MTELLGAAVLELTTDESGLVTGLASARAKTEAQTAAIQRTVDKRMAATSASMKRAGASMTRYLTVPIAGIGVAAVKMAADFDAAMERVHTQSGETQKNVNKLRGEVLALSKVSAQGPTDLANALYRLEGAGIRGQKAMMALKAASDLAAVGNANVEDTAKTLGQAYFSGIKGLGSFKNVVAELNATVGAGDLRLQQLVDALGTGILPNAHQVGLSFHDITAALAVFGDETNNVSGWASQLSTAFHFLTNPTSKATKAFHALGMQQEQLAVDLRKPNGLSVALHDLRDHLDALPGGARGTQATQLLGDILPGGRGRVLTVLLNQIDRLDGKYKQIQDTNGRFAEAVAKTHATAAYKINQAWSSVKADLVDIGHAIGPQAVGALAGFAGAVDHIAKAFDGLPKPLQKTVFQLGLLVAALGPALKLGGMLTGALRRAFVAGTAESAAGGAAAGRAYAAEFGKNAAAGVGAAGAADGAIGGALAGKAARGRWSGLGTSMGQVFGYGFAIEAAREISTGIESALHKSGPNKGGIQDITSLGQFSPSELISKLLGINQTHAGDADKQAKRDAQQVYSTLSGGRKRYVAVARRAAITAGIDPNLFIKQINQESQFNPYARSPAGALGIAQFMPGTAKSVGLKNPFDPDTSLEKAATLMAKYLAEFGSWSKALIAYNAGPGAVGKPLPAETKKYVAAITGGKKTAKTPADTSAGLLWAREMIGHFAESTGQNTGPELDKLQKEFGTHAAAWCAEFATESLVKAGFPKGIKTASVAKINAMAKAGTFGLGFTSSPQAGDLVTFGNQHVGVVESVDRRKGVVHTIEGNTSAGKVARRTHALGSGRYVSADPLGAGMAPSHLPKPKVSLYDQLQKQIDHIKLLEDAGLLPTKKGSERIAALINKALPHLKGDDKLNALVTLRGVTPKPINAAKATWTAANLRALALAYINANQNNPAAITPRIYKAAGIDNSLQNPWLNAYLNNLDNQVDLGAMPEDTANRAKLGAYQRALPYLTGQDRNDAIAQIKSLTDAIEQNTQAQLQTADALRQQGISTAGFLGGLSGPAADTVRGILASYGIQSLPGGASVANIGNPLASSDLARGDINTLMGQVNSGQRSFSDVWSQIQDDLGTIAQATQSTADNTAQTSDALNELLKQQNQELTQRLGVSQAQYGVLKNFPPFGGSFADGGVVPGPVGAARTIVAHGGEVIGQAGGASDVHLHFAPGTEWLRDFVKVEVGQQTRRTARAAGRGLPGAGGR